MVVDTQLMFTIAEVSATFVAIVSGLYTSKILSLSSDRQRIRSKIRGIDAELEPRNRAVEDYEGRLHDYNRKRVEDLVGVFERYLLNHPSPRQYNNVEELVPIYQEFINHEPTELELEAIREQFQSINEKIRKKLSHSGRGSLNSSRFDIASLISPSVIADKIGEREERDAHDWEKKLDEEHIRIDILSESKKNYAQELELKSGSFPRHITFGYMSQVAFAILGVVFPLIHGSWSAYLGDNSNIVAIVLFIIGLATTFAYIISEVWAATHQ